MSPVHHGNGFPLPPTNLNFRESHRMVRRLLLLASAILLLGSGLSGTAEASRRHSARTTAGTGVASHSAHTARVRHSAYQYRYRSPAERLSHRRPAF